MNILIARKFERNAVSRCIRWKDPLSLEQQFKEAETPPVLVNRNNEVAASKPVTRPDQQKVEDLLEALKRAKPKWKTRCTSVVSAGVNAMIAPTVWASCTAHGMGFCVSALVTTGIYAGLASAVERAITGRDRRLAKQLAQYDDKRAVGPLLEALRYDNSSTVNAATVALIRLLPQLRASDRHLLTAEHRSFMNGLLGASVLLGPPKAPALILAMLKALGQVGDSGAIGVVEKLANGGGTGKNPAVQQAAVECLPFLEEVARQEEAHRILLRASASNAFPGALLRPATDAPEHHADQLLRAQMPNAEGRSSDFFPSN